MVEIVQGPIAEKLTPHLFLLQNVNACVLGFQFEGCDWQHAPTYEAFQLSSQQLQLINSLPHEFGLLKLLINSYK